MAVSGAPSLGGDRQYSFAGRREWKPLTWSLQADAIYDMIGFPDFILEPKELDDVYDGVSTFVHSTNLPQSHGPLFPGLSNQSLSTPQQSRHK